MNQATIRKIFREVVTAADLDEIADVAERAATKKHPGSRAEKECVRQAKGLREAASRRRAEDAASAQPA